jgi:tetratricopeptide (TPR) repeat protein
LGTAYHAAGRYEEALAEYQRYLGLNPESAVIHLSLAITYGRSGREAEAWAATSTRSARPG